MAWKGYFTYAGTEIINATRTEHYMEALGTSWFHPIYKADSLPLALGHERYGTPLTDDAPWVDNDLPESTQFYGVYPLDVTGIEDSTVTTSVTESTGNGGALGGVRYASREVVFSAILIADGEDSVEYGFRWLKRALSGRVCDPINPHVGAQLHYLVDEPVIEFDDSETTPAQETILDGGGPGAIDTIVYDGGGPGTVGGITLDGGGPAPEEPESGASQIDPTTCLIPLQRYLRKATVTGPAKITGKRTTTNGMSVWMVQWTVTAADPFEYSLPRPIFQNYRAGVVPVTAAGVVFSPNDTSLFEQFRDLPCPTPLWSPVYDPECLPAVAPPTAPDVALGCWTAPEVWRRWWITTPREEVPVWDAVVPVLDIYAPDVEMRGLRVRFYPDSDVSPVASIANCGWDFDLLVTYLPEGFRLRIDAVSQTITAMGPDGMPRAAGSLVMGSDGKPFTWPELSCDQGYVVVFDIAPDNDLAPVKPVTSLSLVTKVAA